MPLEVVMGHFEKPQKIRKNILLVFAPSLSSKLMRYQGTLCIEACNQKISNSELPMTSVWYKPEYC